MKDCATNVAKDVVCGVGGKRQEITPLSTDTVTPYDRQAFSSINLLYTIVIEHFMG